MATTFYPLIKRDEFESFRRVIHGDFPDTYDEWEQLSGNQTLKLAGQGFQVIRPEIDFDEYLAWATGRGDDKTIHSLKTFSGVVHARNQGREA